MKSDVARYCDSLGRIVRARFRRNERAESFSFADVLHCRCSLDSKLTLAVMHAHCRTRADLFQRVPAVTSIFSFSFLHVRNVATNTHLPRHAR